MTTYLYFYSQIILLLSRFVNIVSVQCETTSFQTGMYMYVHYHTVTLAQKLSNYLCQKHSAQYSIFDVWLNVAFWKFLMMTWKKIPKSELKILISNAAHTFKSLLATVAVGSFLLWALTVHCSLMLIFMHYNERKSFCLAINVKHFFPRWFILYKKECVFSLLAKLSLFSPLSFCFLF